MIAVVVDDSNAVLQHGSLRSHSSIMAAHPQ
jgi:hypothetical protein